MIKDNVENVRNRIRAAQEASPYGEEVRLVGVSKFREIRELEELVACGLTVLGENRVQELMDKYPHFEGRVDWHLIGTLQKNKVKYVVGKVSLIHSVDSLSLLKEIEKQAGKQGVTVSVLLQVNTAGEQSKHGFSPDEVDGALLAASEMPHVQVDGLMMIAPDTQDREYLTKLFQKTRKLYDNMMKKYQIYDNIKIKVLSMGMTNDFELAISCGANMVRIGRALFV